MKPAVKGLESDDLSAPPEEVAGLDYSQPWHDDYVAAKDLIRHNLHMLHPSMQQSLGICQQALNDILVVDCTQYRSVYFSAYIHLKLMDVFQH